MDFNRIYLFVLIHIMNILENNETIFILFLSYLKWSRVDEGKRYCNDMRRTKVHNPKFKWNIPVDIKVSEWKDCSSLIPTVVSSRPSKGQRQAGRRNANKKAGGMARHRREPYKNRRESMAGQSGEAIHKYLV